MDYENKPSWVPNAANAVYRRFKGQKVKDSEVYRFIIAETPFPKRKAILEHLAKSSPPRIIEVIRPSRSSRGFPDGCLITFSE
ncbi:hypothetical protein JXA31_04605 [Candidatus Bathyarchaeota archaeon]|nr:hypothetical protein [Candidatus Bathyarchaeota archaeon]